MRLDLRRGSPAPALLAMSLLLSGTAAACSGHAASSADGGSSPAPEMAGAASVPAGTVRIPTAAEATAAWDARPGFVRALPDDWQAAYRFALERPDVVAWMPCNCGCGGQGHRSNLDCFFDDRETGGIAFLEHGSFCDICVNTANLAAKLLGQGESLSAIRAAVDAQFGGGDHGTDTPLPPS